MNQFPPPNGQGRNGQFNGMFTTSQLGLGNGLRQLVWLLLFAWLLGSLGLGWLVKFSLVVIGLLILLPIVGIFGLQWWIKRNLVQDNCPVCDYEISGLNGSQFQCPNCGEPLQVVQGKVTRLTPEGTIDVQAVDVVDVSAKAVDE